MKQAYEAEARADLSELILGIRALQTDDHFVKRACFFGIRDTQCVAVNVLPSGKIKGQFNNKKYTDAM
jgi:hypothetical protein